MSMKILKKFPALCLTFMLLPQVNASQMEPHCKAANALENWNDRAAIVRKKPNSWNDKYWLTMKFCSLEHQTNISLSASDLLQGANDYIHGKNVPFQAQIINNHYNIGTSSINLSGNGAPPVDTLLSPVIFMTEKSNQKNVPNSTSGIFRLYSKVGTSKGGCAGASEPFGYKHIRNSRMKYFFKKIQVNGKNITPYSSAGGMFAIAKDVELIQGNDTVKANIYFLEGLNESASGGWFREICAIDTYLKLELKPEGPPNIKASGTYDLNFTWVGPNP